MNTPDEVVANLRLPPSSFLLVETPRLWLRAFTEEDAPLLLELDSDPEVMRYIGPYALPDVAAYRLQLRTKFMPYYAVRNGLGVWALIEKASGNFLGWHLLRPARDQRFADAVGFQDDEVEIGYRLRRAAWGQGFATEAARALLPFAFAQEQVRQVVAVALLANRGSWHVMEKLGMMRSGEVFFPGVTEPGVKYALPRQQWRPCG